MDETLLQKLTIVIFSYNRHEYLKRTIKYWSELNVKLLVLDGSDTKLDDPCTNQNNTKYIYDQRDLYNRLLSSINHINTEFMILSCDDEFYLPSALSECIKFLIGNNDFSSCGGCALSFKTFNKELLGAIEYPDLKNLCLNHNDLSLRIRSHFNNYVPAHLYSVVRSSKWKIICKNVFEKEYSFFAAWELQIEFLIMVSGKSKIIPELMWLRNKEVPSIRGTSPSMSNDVLISEWWYEKNFKDEKINFLHKIEKTSNELSANQNFKFTKNLISELFEVYINNHSRGKLIRKKFYKKVINLIPLKLKNFIKKFLFLKNIERNKTGTLLKEAKKLELDRILVNYNELEKITRILLH